MDSLEATNILLSKIRNIDPENASRIMGYILLQDFVDRDLLRLAFGPDSLLQNLILEAKSHLGLPSNTFSTSSSSLPNTPSPSNPIPRSLNVNGPFSLSSPRLVKTGPFVDFGRNLSSPSNSRPVSHSFSPKSSPLLSYDNIRSGSGLVPSPFSENGGVGGGDFSNGDDSLLDECKLDDYLSFLDESSSKGEDFGDPRVQLSGFGVENGDAYLHRRRFSESDACFGGDEGLGNGYRPSLYSNRGPCKNGDGCKFFRGGGFEEAAAGGGAIVGSPSEIDSLYLQQPQHQHEEMMRMKVAQQQQQQRLAYTKYMNFLSQKQNDPRRFGAAAMLMADELHKLGRFRPERNEFFAMGMPEKAIPASRQIYLTFPADSSFKDEDVSNYFSTFGEVQDVRIPYQQKRMFGFVTFMHPETVKLILARGNPHFICDSRVLVKPYKEKGKAATERQYHLQQQQLERGNFSPSSSPCGLDPRELYDLHLGGRMVVDTQEMMMRRRLEEQAELQHAIELQGRRLIELKLPDLRGDYGPHHQRSLSIGSPISLANRTPITQHVILASDGKNQEATEAAAASPQVATSENNLENEVNAACILKNGGSNIIEICKEEVSDKAHAVPEVNESSVGNPLPDSLFTSSTKKSGFESPNLSSTLAETEACTELSVIPCSDIAPHS